MGKPQNGNVRINLKFKAALTSGVTLIVYSKFSDVIQMDSSRNVYTGFLNMHKIEAHLKYYHYECNAES